MHQLKISMTFKAMTTRVKPEKTFICDSFSLKNPTDNNIRYHSIFDPINQAQPCTTTIAKASSNTGPADLFQ